MKVNSISEYKNFTGKENMEMDLAMLNYAIENKSGEFFVRFYGWEPKCISLGRNQKEFLYKTDIDVVRRPTGGRALLHDMEITYSIAGKIPSGYGVLETYKMVSDVLIKGFSALGIDLSYAGNRDGKNNYCMNISTGADICYKGRKLIGSAQFRKDGYFLQHGSILKDADFDLIEKVFSEPVDRNKIVTLKEINPEISDTDVIEALWKEFLK